VQSGFASESLAVPALDDSFRLNGVQATAEEAPARILPAAVTRPDWHNARARLLLDLDARLDALPTDAAREDLVASLSRLLPTAPAAQIGERRAPIRSDPEPSMETKDAKLQVARP